MEVCASGGLWGEEEWGLRVLRSWVLGLELEELGVGFCGLGFESLGLGLRVGGVGIQDFIFRCA